MNPKPPVSLSQSVFVVDDNPSVRNGLARLLRAAGFNVEVFASADEYLSRVRASPAQGGCLVLDVQMPGRSGMDLQDSLCEGEHSIPIIFITGHGDIPMSVRAMKKGAVDFLAKPFDPQELLNAIRIALLKDQQTRRRWAVIDDLRIREQSLTPREREVMKLVITGMLNKQIAAELCASEGTIKVHRARVMTKMGVQSVAELVKLCGYIEVDSTPP